MMHFSYHPNFEKQFDKLKKKYPSLQKDFDVFCLALEVNPKGYPPNTVQVDGLGENVFLPFFKARKFPLTCMRLANSGLRIVYAYDRENDQLEFVEFVEIYHKNNQDNHNIELIKEHYTGVTDLGS